MLPVRVAAASSIKGVTVGKSMLAPLTGIQGFMEVSILGVASRMIIGPLMD